MKYERVTMEDVRRMRRWFRERGGTFFGQQTFRLQDADDNELHALMVAVRAEPHRRRAWEARVRQDYEPQFWEQNGSQTFMDELWHQQGMYHLYANIPERARRVRTLIENTGWDLSTWSQNTQRMREDIRIWSENQVQANAPPKPPAPPVNEPPVDVQLHLAIQRMALWTNGYRQRMKERDGQVHHYRLKDLMEYIREMDPEFYQRMGAAIANMPHVSETKGERIFLNVLHQIARDPDTYMRTILQQAKAQQQQQQQTMPANNQDPGDDLKKKTLEEDDGMHIEKLLPDDDEDLKMKKSTSFGDLSILEYRPSQESTEIRNPNGQTPLVLPLRYPEAKPKAKPSRPAVITVQAKEKDVPAKQTKGKEKKIRTPLPPKESE